MRAFAPASLAVALLAACAAQAPPLPEVSADDFPPAAKAHVRQAQAALDANPEDPQANGRLGMLLHAHERFAPALACYRRAGAFAPGEPRWPYLQGAALLASGDASGAVAAFDSALKMGRSAPAFIQLGKALEGAGRLADSRKAFEDALQLAPEAPAALFGLARVLAAEGNYAEAVPLLEKAVRLAPDAGAIHYALGVAQRSTGNAKASRRSFGMAERFQRAQPPADDPFLDAVHALRRDPDWLLREGRRLEAKGDIHKAAALYQEAVDQDPRFALGHSSLVGALGLLGRFGDAEKHYLWALKVAPGLEELHYNWGIVLAEQGDYEAAAQSFRTALEINPDSADSRFNLGSMLAQLGLEADAVREIEAALNLDPGHRLALFQLARRNIQAGRLDDAIAQLKRAVDAPIDARSPAILYALADAYARKDDPDSALLHARQALELAVELGDERMAEALRGDIRALAAIP